MSGSQISCQAHCDPEAEVTLSGDALDNVADASCEPQKEGNGWLCSQTATFVRDGNVECKAMHRGKLVCPNDNCQPFSLRSKYQ